MFDQEAVPRSRLYLGWPALSTVFVCKSTDWLLSDPPSSCSAGPQGDDLVNIHETICRRFRTNISSVPLASDNHGTGTTTLYITNTALQQSTNTFTRETLRSKAACFSFPSTFPQTTPSSLPRSTSPPASTTRISTRTAPSAWTF